jgi:hypothetical protein
MPSLSGRPALSAPAPNPARVRVRFTATLAGHEPAVIAMHDVAGRLLDRSTLAGDGAHSVQLPAPTRPGVYLVTLTQGGRSSTRSFIVR